jgi:hypothetical protein
VAFRLVHLHLARVANITNAAVAIAAVASQPTSFSERTAGAADRQQGDFTHAVPTKDFLGEKRRSRLAKGECKAN